MNLHFRSMRKLICFVCCLVYGTTSVAGDLESDTYFSSIERITRYSPLEHAGSHGTLGIGLGGGVGSYALEGDVEVLKAHWRSAGTTPDSNAAGSGTIYIPRVYLHKGLPWSLDAGISYGLHRESNATVAGTYLQWTAFEGFALPSLAVRGSMGRLMGLQTTDATMIGGEILASYGFLRIFTIYGGIGNARSQIKVRSGAEYGTSLTLTGSADNSINRIHVAQTRTMGLQVQLLPPFVGFTIESQTTDGGPQSYLGKLSVGM